MTWYSRKIIYLVGLLAIVLLRRYTDFSFEFSLVLSILLVVAMKIFQRKK